MVQSYQKSTQSDGRIDGNAGVWCGKGRALVIVIMKISTFTGRSREDELIGDSTVTFQASNVLAILSIREATDEDIARELDMPEASVRRSVTELVKAGYRIVRPGKGQGSWTDRCYRLL